MKCWLLGQYECCKINTFLKRMEWVMLCDHYTDHDDEEEDENIDDDNVDFTLYLLDILTT